MREKLAKFKYWFVNVFWYHYKWYPIIALAVIAILYALLSDTFKGVSADYQVLLTSRYYVAEEQVSEIQEVMGQVVGDRNGDGRTYVPFIIMNLTSGEVEYNNRMKLTANMATDDAVLYIFDENTADNFLEDGLFEPLENLGFTGTDGSPYLLRVDQLPLFDRAGFSMFADRFDMKYYACFKKMPENIQENPELQEKYDLGKQVLTALLEAK